jgi:seryl-tRNA synthetase
MNAKKYSYNKYFKSRVKKKKVKKKKRKVIKKIAKKVVKKKKKNIEKLVKKKKKEIKKKIQKKEKKPPEQEPEIEEEMLHFNLMGESDPKVIAYQILIQKEVDRVWAPPIGVPKGTECLVNFIIDKKGNVKKLKILKPSEIVIYDLSIVRVEKEFKFEKCFWGKSFTINFRQ